MSIRGVRAPCRENAIQHHCSLWLQRVEGKDQKKQSKPSPGESRPPRAPLRRREWQQAVCNQLASRTRFNPLHLAFRNISVLIFNRGCFCYFCKSQHMRPLWENLNH